ncbi:MAG: Na(+)/H(+) antiporter subunit D [Myxococcales bacterium]|nr:Na(+)/H(+) antiporter subunit D [Myxococcales bacterium]|tara:strand:- start:666 stop:2444 length:1779 start_codon:yes stop_codon:yes gene_type:complete
MSNYIFPGFILIFGGLLLPLFPKSLRKWVALALPVLSCVHMHYLPEGYALTTQIFEYTLTPVRMDKLSLVWGYVFHLAALMSVLYQMHVKDTLQDVSGITYAGAAVGAVFAGDLITLFVYWELTAITSVFLIYANRTPTAAKIGTRYLIIQVASGVILFFGVLLWVRETGSVDIGSFTYGEDNWHLFGPFVNPETGMPVSMASWIILFAFGIKAAFPFLHNWLQDSYPAATATGTVFLSAFTTKLAIYALVRCYAGTSILIPIGLVMTLFPIIFAVIENDLRKVLAYSLNNQLGYMVVGAGVGTELALNGAAAHAFAHIIYKGLLFMAMGAVLYRVGTTKANQLGGLHKSMPLTTIFCIIGSLSISGMPGFSGFVTKSMTLSAAFGTHDVLLFVGLLIASAGVVDHSGIKIPFFAFFAHDSGKRCKEAPINMLLAMGIAAFFCIFLGIYPQPLYDILPFEVRADVNGAEWHNYSASHVYTSFQLLFMAALAFVVLMKTNMYPPELSCTNLDTDVVYRRWLKRSAMTIGSTIQSIWSRTLGSIKAQIVGTVQRVGDQARPNSILGEPWTIGRTALWAAILLLFVFVSGMTKVM